MRFHPCILTLLLLSVPAITEARKPKGPPPAPARFETRWHAGARPAGDGWLLLKQSDGDVVLVRDGSHDPHASPSDSWSAQVVVMPATGATTAEALQAFLEREYRGPLLSSGRFLLREWSAAADATRMAPCVRYRMDTTDQAAQSPSGGTEVLRLVEEGLACEVTSPAPGAVFVKMSWRGTDSAAGAPLKSRFDDWLSGVRLVGAPVTPAPPTQ